MKLLERIWISIRLLLPIWAGLGAAHNTSGSPLEEWVLRPSPTDIHMPGVAYGNGRFVAVTSQAVSGGPSYSLTSRDGTNWTLHDFLPSGFLWEVSYLEGEFLAVGSTGNDTIIFSSQDGTAWSPRGTNTTAYAFSMTLGDGVYVAAGGATFVNGIIFTHHGGDDWVERHRGPQTFRKVYYATGLFIAVGREVVTSPNGVDWTSEGPAETDLFGVAYGNGVFVLVGDNGNIWTSPDTINWLKQSVGGSSSYWQDITFAAGQFVAVGWSPSGNASSIVTSTNGTNWVLRGPVAGRGLRGVAYGGGTFVAVGIEGIILQSGNVLNVAPATLSVRNPPTGKGFELSFAGQPGCRYTLQGNDDLSTTDWIDLFTFTLSQPMTNLLDTNATVLRQRFYRTIGP